MLVLYPGVGYAAASMESGPPESPWHASDLMPPAQMCDEGGPRIPQLLYIWPQSVFDMNGTAAYFSTSETSEAPFKYWVSVNPLRTCISGDMGVRRRVGIWLGERENRHDGGQPLALSSRQGSEPESKRTIQRCTTACR